MLVVELLENIRLELLVVANRGQDLLALLVGGGLDEVGDLRRMQARESARAKLQPRGGYVRKERLDLMPRHDLFLVSRVAAEAAREEAPEAWSEARNYARHTPHAVVLTHKLHLMRSDQSRCGHVDHPPVQEVTSQQHLTGAALELREVQLRGRRLGDLGAELLDVCDRHEQFTPTDSRFEPHHGRQRVTEIQARNDVLNPPKSAPVRIKQRAPHERGEVNDLCGHQPPVELSVRYSADSSHQ